eukprot:TRINITY_DN5695_c0_g1_i1.p1 TRINITY_DN5695_c0_g1~~TRINITY_DN5695_c0_g1_i1.p1  ORF type:complete len:2773 (-),score=509.09 TRINITY_DN5695_c0_g1_i1:66-7241(-)
MSGLQATPVHRLSHTWTAVLSKEKTKAKLEFLQAFISREGNFPEFRAAHAKSQTPMIPYLGIILQDMLFVDEGNKNLDSNGYINFQKRRRWYQCCQLIDNFTTTPFAFAPNEPLQEFLTHFDRYDDEWLFQRSNLIEPRKCTVKDLQVLSVKKSLRRPEAHMPQALVPQITKKWEKEKALIGVALDEFPTSVSGTTFSALFRSLLFLEQDYLRKMEVLLRVGVRPLVQFRMISAESAARLFSCVEAVNDLHTQLYQSLLQYYQCPYHKSPCRNNSTFWDYHRECDVGELFLQKLPLMRAVYNEFFSHFSEERITALLSEATTEVASIEENGEGTGNVGGDLLAYEELIKENVPGFTYVSYMQRVMNQIGHQFTFLRKTQQMVSHSSSLSAAISDLGRLLAQVRTLSTTAARTEFNEPIYNCQKMLKGFNGRLWHKNRTFQFQGECHLIGLGLIERHSVFFFNDSILICSRTQPSHFDKLQAPPPQTEETKEADIEKSQGEELKEEAPATPRADVAAQSVQQKSTPQKQNVEEEKYHFLGMLSSKHLQMKPMAKDKALQLVSSLGGIISVTARMSVKHTFQLVYKDGRECYVIGLDEAQTALWTSYFKSCPQHNSSELTSIQTTSVSGRYYHAGLPDPASGAFFLFGGEERRATERKKVSPDDDKPNFLLNIEEVEERSKEALASSSSRDSIVGEGSHSLTSFSSQDLIGSKVVSTSSNDCLSSSLSAGSKDNLIGSKITSTSSKDGLSSSHDGLASKEDCIDTSLTGSSSNSSLTGSMSHLPGPLHRRFSSSNKLFNRSPNRRARSESTNSIGSTGSADLEQSNPEMYRKEFREILAYDSKNDQWGTVETYRRTVLTPAPPIPSPGDAVEDTVDESRSMTSGSLPSITSSHPSTSPIAVPIQIPSPSPSNGPLSPTAGSGLKTIATDSERRTRSMKRTKTENEEHSSMPKRFTNSYGRTSSSSLLTSLSLDSSPPIRTLQATNTVGTPRSGHSGTQSLEESEFEETTTEGDDDIPAKRLSVPKIAPLPQTDEKPNKKKGNASPRGNSKKERQKISNLIPASPRKKQDFLRRSQTEGADSLGEEDASEDVDPSSGHVAHLLQTKGRRTTLGRLPIGRNKNSKSDSAKLSPSCGPSPMASPKTHTSVNHTVEPTVVEAEAPKSVSRPSRFSGKSPSVSDIDQRGLKKQSLPYISRHTMSWVYRDGLIFGGLVDGKVSNSLYILFGLAQSPEVGFLEWKEVKPWDPAYILSSAPAVPAYPPSLPHPRCNHSAVTRHDHNEKYPENQFSDCHKLYIFGGADSISKGRTYFNDIWEYDLTSGVWTELVPKNVGFSPEPRAGHMMILSEKTIYVFGGYSAKGLLNDMWSFDLETHLWCRVTATGFIPSPRAEAAVIKKGKNSYLFFGGRVEGDKLTNEIFVYDTAGGTWSFLATPKKLPRCSSVTILPSLVNPTEEETKEIKFSVFGGFAVLNDIRRLRRAQKTDTEESEEYFSASEDNDACYDIDEEEEVDSSSLSVVTPNILFNGFNIRIPTDCQRSLVHFEGSEYRKNLAGLSKKDNHVNYRSIYLYKPSTTNEDDLWEDDNRLYPFNLTHPEIHGAHPKQTPSLTHNGHVDTHAHVLAHLHHGRPRYSALKFVTRRWEEEVPLLVTLQDLIDDWSWDKNVLPLLVSTEKLADTEHKDFLPLVELKSGVSLTFALLFLSPSSTMQNEELSKWDEAVVKVNNTYALRCFGTTLTPVLSGKSEESWKHVVVYESVPDDVFTLESILETIRDSIHSKINSTEAQSLSCPNSPNEAYTKPRGERHHALSKDEESLLKSVKSLSGDDRIRTSLSMHRPQIERRQSRNEDESKEAEEIPPFEEAEALEITATTAITTTATSNTSTTATTSATSAITSLVSLEQTRFLMWCLCQALAEFQNSGISANLSISSILVYPNGHVKLVPKPWSTEGVNDSTSDVQVVEKVLQQLIGEIPADVTNAATTLVTPLTIPLGATNPSTAVVASPRGAPDTNAAITTSAITGDVTSSSANTTTPDVPGEDAQIIAEVPKEASVSCLESESVEGTMLASIPPKQKVPDNDQVLLASLLVAFSQQTTFQDLLNHPFFRLCKQTSTKKIFEVIQGLHQHTSNLREQKRQQEMAAQAAAEAAAQAAAQAAAEQAAAEAAEQAAEQAAAEQVAAEAVPQKVVSSELLSVHEYSGRANKRSPRPKSVELKHSPRETYLSLQERANKKSMDDLRKQLATKQQEFEKELLQNLITPLREENKKMSETIDKLTATTAWQTEQIALLLQEVQYLRTMLPRSSPQETKDHNETEQSASQTKSENSVESSEKSETTSVEPTRGVDSNNEDWTSEVDASEVETTSEGASNTSEVKATSEVDITSEVETANGADPVESISEVDK